jgi:hypothetical protein
MHTYFFREITYMNQVPRYFQISHRPLHDSSVPSERSQNGVPPPSPSIHTICFSALGVLLYPKDGGNMFLRNVGKLLLHYIQDGTVYPITITIAIRTSGLTQ